MTSFLCVLLGHKLKFYSENGGVGDCLPFLNECERCGRIVAGWDDLRKPTDLEGHCGTCGAKLEED